MKSASTLAFVLLAACGTEDYSSSTSLSRAPGECADVEVHVIGVSDGYEGSNITLLRPGKHILVLSSYETNTWNVTVGQDATLERVYAVGYEPQRVVTNVSTTIQTESAMEGGTGAYGYAYPGRDAVGLLRLAAVRVARHPTSFHGCFAARNWTIGEDMIVASDCPSSTYTQYNAVIDCDGDNFCGDGDGTSGPVEEGSGSGSGDSSADPFLY